MTASVIAPALVLPSVVGMSAISALVDRASQAPAGAFAELGVYQGGTACWLAAVARVQTRALWLFDTFTGIPFADPVDQHQVGDFGDTSLEAIAKAIPEAIIVPGVFPQSLDGCLLPSFAFVHVDADQYRSVRSACLIFGQLMVPGGVMWFDDYQSPTTPGATLAVDECFPGRLEKDACGKSFVRFA